MVISQTEPQLAHMVFLNLGESQSFSVATSVHVPDRPVSSLDVSRIDLPTHRRLSKYFVHLFGISEYYFAGNFEDPILLVLLYDLDVEQVVGRHEPRIRSSSSCRLSVRIFVTVHGLYCLIQVKTRKASTIDLNVSALAF